MSADNGPSGGSKPQSSPLDVARSYIARGWNPVPVPFKAKKPDGNAWQKRTITLQNVERYFNTGPQNIGVQLGPKSGDLADVDLDSLSLIHI